MDKRFFEKRCTYSIRKFALGAASVMIGASFFATAPVMANTPTVGSTDNCQVSWLIWIKSER